MISSASSFEAPSLTGLPPASTSSLASFRPRPVMPRTSLITLILDAPADFRMTSNSVCSSAASPPASPPAGPAIMTAPPAAGSMPYSSLRMVLSSCASSRVRPTICSASALRSAIVTSFHI
ncbi:50S ribosomal protein L7/L12 [Roseivivax marinus]|uniref:50S ribosomal protein L7/L12 n=1 Tax=Roseivivax marinus TaxID=1379903 RepID=W4HNY4_9RHOB|nr:50S ribosomal protein L7/L12 [Roseivivax marinus]